MTVRLRLFPPTIIGSAPVGNVYTRRNMVSISLRHERIQVEKVGVNKF